MEIKTEKEKVKKRLDEIKRQNAPMQKRLDEVTKKVAELENYTRELVSVLQVLLHVSGLSNDLFLIIITIIPLCSVASMGHQPVKLPNH